VRVASAGESVAGSVNAHALECLRVHGIATEELQSKAWANSSVSRGRRSGF
jgi:protein-tyrosine-phosphatase